MLSHPYRFFLATGLIGGVVVLGCYLGGEAPTTDPGFKSGSKISRSPGRQRPFLTGKHLEAQPGAPLFNLDAWHLPAVNVEPFAPTETWADRQIEATARLKPGSLPALGSLRTGKRFPLPLHGAQATARVISATTAEGGWTRVAGVFEGKEPGSFFLSQQGPAFFGRIIQPSLSRAYRVATDPDGTVVMEQKPLASVQCAAIPRKPRPPGTTAQASAPSATFASTPFVPVLDSNPAATNVIYIDFDGETVTDPDWNNGKSIIAAAPTMKGAALSSAQITDIWQRVVEDYRPFKVSITTNFSRYTAAGPRHRIRCIVTPTDKAAPGAGGVAWTDSFREAGVDFSTTIPCWAFAEDYYTTADISGIISHEVGHTMGLSHDGRASPYEEYFDGQGSGPNSWAPIMGATYDHNVTQWSKGEYYRANNHEDDIAIIGGAANGFGFVADEDTSASPVILPNNGAIAVSGIISGQADVDQYLFATAGGTVSITATPAAVEPDLDILLEIRNQTGTTVLASSNLLNALNASITTTLPLGTYRIAIRGTGEGSAVGVGYSSYGSVGAYTITGSYPEIPVTAPVITTQPAPAGVRAGYGATFSVAATSAVPPSYQWQKNSVDIPGQTSSTLVFASVQTINQGDYRCLVSDIAGSTPSNAAPLAVFDKPVITVQPVATTVAAGSSTPLTLSLIAGGTPAIRYQWQHAALDLAGQTSSVLILANPQGPDGGSYRCVVSNDYGSVVSSSVTVTIVAPPFVVTQPPPAKELPKGGSSSIALVSGGTAPLTYQWYKGAVKVAGAIKAALAFTSIPEAAAGTYHCVVTNRIGSVTSADCVVTVGTLPVFTLQPLGQTVREGAPFQWIVAATGSDTLSFQWQRDGVNVSTGATFSIASAAWIDHGVYRCIASNGAGSTLSKAATLTVQAGPLIVASPTSGKIAIGGKATLKVTAAGSPVLKYQWRKAGVNLPGAVAASLVITGTTSTSYDVVVSNPFNPQGILSATANITALAAPKIMQQPLARTAALGSDADFNVQASGDGLLLYQWKKNGVAINTQTAASLHLSSMVAADGALYSVTVTNDVGTVTSSAVRLTLLAPPKIIVKPVATTAKANNAAALTSTATGAATLRYHWQKDNADIIGATSATFKIASAHPADAGLYRVVISNSVATVYSDPVTLMVVVPPPPSVSTFTPTQGPAGSYVRLSGTGLDNTTRVTLQALKGTIAAAAFVIVSPEELLITVPAGALASAFTLTGSADGVTTANAFVVTTKQANDDFINAQIIPGTGGTVTGTNATMTGEAGEPSHALDPSYPASDYLPSHSVWYSFTPASSGNYSVSTAGSSFDTRLAVYTGTAVDALAEVSSNDEASDTLSTSFCVFPATAGTPYFIAVDGFQIHYADTGEDYDEYGPYVLKVAKLAAGATATAQDGTAMTQTTGSGSGWLPVAVPSKAGALTVGLRMEFTPQPGMDGQASWMVCNATRQPLFGLRLATGTGALSASSLSVPTFFTGQTLVANEKYWLQFAIDSARQTWGVLLNGEWIVRDQFLPKGVSIAGVQVLRASSVPQAGASLPADEFEVTTE